MCRECIVAEPGSLWLPGKMVFKLHLYTVKTTSAKIILGEHSVVSGREGGFPHIDLLM